MEQYGVTVQLLVLVFAAGVIALNLMDLWSTEKALAKGGRELNPIFAMLMLRVGGKWKAIKIVCALVVLGLLIWLNSIVSVVALGLLNLFYIWVVLHNLGVIKRLDGGA
jgi:hypothetical protein